MSPFYLRYMVYSLYLTLAYGQTERFLGGRCILGQTDVILYNTHYNACIDQCRARAACLSISVHSRGQICRLHFDTSETSELHDCMGYVLSEKETWRQKDLKGCEDRFSSSGHVCVIGEDGMPTLIYTECPAVTIKHATIYGNRRNLGSRILYVCDSGFRTSQGDGFMTCGPDGSWIGGPTPTCLQYEFHFPENPGKPDFDLVNLYANNITLIGRSWIPVRVKATGDVEVMLTPQRDHDRNDAIEIVIGGWGNTMSVIRHGVSSGSVTDTHREVNIVSEVAFRDYWIRVTPAFCIQVCSPSCVKRPQLQY